MKKLLEVLTYRSVWLRLPVYGILALVLAFLAMEWKDWDPLRPPTGLPVATVQQAARDRIALEGERVAQQRTIQELRLKPKAAAKLERDFALDLKMPGEATGDTLLDVVDVPPAPDGAKVVLTLDDAGAVQAKLKMEPPKFAELGGPFVFSLELATSDRGQMLAAQLAKELGRVGRWHEKAFVRVQALTKPPAGVPPMQWAAGFQGEVKF